MLDAFREAIIRFFEGLFREKIDEEKFYLRMEIDKCRREKEVLLDYILSLNKPVQIDHEPINPDYYKPLKNQRIPWPRMKADLEEKARKKAEVEEIEKEVGIG